MLFQEIIGQEEIKNNLLKAVAGGRISHAYMMLSSEGTGSLSLAIAFARYIQCLKKPENDSCNECPSCIKIQKLAHPDLHFVYPVAASKKVDKEPKQIVVQRDRQPGATTKKVDKEPVSDDFIQSWREAVLQNPYLNLAEWYEKIGIENKQGIITIHESKEILRKLSLKAFESDYKIMIIWMPEKLNTPAANKLLKLLEEPPDKTIFLLVSQDTSQILPTILSRTQLIKIPKLSDKDLKEALVSRFGLTNQKEIEAIADYARGNFLLALEALNKNTNNGENFKFFVDLMRICYATDIPKLNEWVEVIAGIGREKQKHFLSFALNVIRSNYMMNLGQDGLVQLNEEEKAWSKKFSKFVHTGNISQLATEFSHAYHHIEYNANAKIVFFHMGLRIVKLLKT